MSTNTSPRASGRSGRARADRPGVLVRAVLEELANSGALRNSEGGQLLIGQDTLKLHVGKIAWLAVEGDSRRTQVDPESPIRLPPGGIVTVVTQEEISVPLNLTGVIYPRGRLLPLGVLSTTVHVDPGFRGNCRVIVMNLGTKVVDILMDTKSRVYNSHT